MTGPSLTIVAAPVDDHITLSPAACSPQAGVEHFASVRARLAEM
jgi:hypothetical protein